MIANISNIYTPIVVIVENDENDALILARVLQRTGLDVRSHWVSTLEEFASFIDAEPFDLVLSDYNLQGCTANDVLATLHERSIVKPVLVVSHHIGEKAAVEAMRSGARDIVNKGDHKHLLASISKELADIERKQERDKLTTQLYDIDREKRELEVALQKVKEAEAQSKSLLNQLDNVFNCSPDGIRVIDKEYNVIRVNSNYLKMMERQEETMPLGKCYDLTQREWCDTSQCSLRRVLAGERQFEETLKIKDLNGQERQYVLTVSALIREDGDVEGMVENLKDVTEWHRMQRQVLHAQKMESIGQLAAGIAHEINTPTQFVGDNISFLKSSFGDLVKLLKLYDGMLDKAKSIGWEHEMVEEIEQTKEDLDLAFLIDEIPMAISQSEEGTGRISSIVKAMKEFSHPGSEDAELFNVNQNIQNTVTVARNEWKYVSRVNLDLGFKVPLVRGYPGEFNQTILNIIVNAAHAIEQKSVQIANWKGTISLKTYTASGHVVIEISDNGCGIPKEILDRVYDPFFTTKPVGKGTGQGLAIAHSSIVDKHNGTIVVQSVVGEGTTFTISLPSVELEGKEG